MITQCKDCQQYLRLYLKEYCQQVEGCCPSSPLSACEAACRRVLSPVQGCPLQANYGCTGVTTAKALSSCSELVLQHVPEAIPGAGDLLQGLPAACSHPNGWMLASPGPARVTCCFSLQGISSISASAHSSSSTPTVQAPGTGN